MEAIWGVIIGSLLTIAGSIIGQAILAKYETNKWELNRNAQLEDRRIDLKINLITVRCDQIEKALRIYTQDFFYSDKFFQRLIQLHVEEDKFAEAREFVKGRIRELWKSRDPEIHELYNLNAIVYSVGKQEMEEEWEKLLNAWNTFVELANGLSNNFEENYKSYVLNAHTEDSIFYKTQKQFRESSRKIYIMLNEIRSTF